LCLPYVQLGWEVQGVVGLDGGLDLLSTDHYLSQ
jgi:hypothetical protein